MKKIKIKIKTISLLGVLASTLTLINPTTHAAVIFDNGIVSGGTAGGPADPDVSANKNADDFTLTSGATVQSIGWRGKLIIQPSAAYTYNPLNDDFTIRIYSDSSGPGSLLHTFSIGNSATLTDTGLTSGNSNNKVYDYSVNITPTALLAGTYWISLFNNTVADTDDNWAWIYGTDGVSSGNAFATNNDGATWSSGTNSFAFHLNNTPVAPVPVPAAVWLMGSALLGLFGFSKRKKA